jgi:hypothetical protein
MKNKTVFLLLILSLQAGQALAWNWPWETAPATTPGGVANMAAPPGGAACCTPSGSGSGSGSGVGTAAVGGSIVGAVASACGFGSNPFGSGLSFNRNFALPQMPTTRGCDMDVVGSLNQTINQAMLGASQNILDTLKSPPRTNTLTCNINLNAIFGGSLGMMSALMSAVEQMLINAINSLDFCACAENMANQLTTTTVNTGGIKQ